MLTFYIDEDGKIYKWNKKLLQNINEGDPISIEYKKIQIVSNNFDKIGCSQVMVLNFIKHKQDREAVTENIVYYDKEAKPKKINGKKTLIIDIFKPDQYGNSITYYNPSYNKDIINISTQFLEIDEMPEFILGGIDKVFSLASYIPQYGMYFDLLGNIVTVSLSLLSNLNHKKELSREHILQFRSDDINKPLLKGNYLCLPNISDFNIDEYYMEDNILKCVNNKPFKDSYFILEVSNRKRNNLLDFNFMVNSNNLLDKINNKHKESLGTFLNINKDSYNFNIIRNIVSLYNGGDFSSIKHLYSHLQDDYKMWFDENFRYIVEKI